MRLSLMPLKSCLVMASAALPLLFWDGCKTVEYGITPTTPSDTAKTTKATLTVTNKLAKDPSKLTFKLYAPTVTSIEAAAGTRLGDVDTGKTVTFTVDPGSYKIGYADAAGNLQAMPGDTLEGGQVDWPIVIFKKGESHRINLFTDIGGVSVWQSDFYNP